MANHEGLKPLPTYIQERHLKKNKKPAVSAATKHQCYFCSKTADFQSSLFTHMRKHTKEKSYKCEKCSQLFVTRAYLVRHVARKVCDDISVNPWREKCYFCQKHFTEYRNLTEHIRTVHLREGLQRCNICSKYFSRVEFHIRTVHLKELIFKCELCARTYSRRGTLNKHIVSTHTTERPYSCYFCNNTFCVASYLTLHMRRHTRERSFYCYFCNHPFAEASAYSAHVRYKHTKERPFRCLRCPNRYFTLTGELNRHIRNKHSNSNLQK
jgi:KRAB domain-containing zinc finger protein